MPQSLVRILLLGFAVATTGAAEVVQFTGIGVEPARSGKNLLPNAGFEAGQPGSIPAGWLWDRRNTDAVCALDSTQAHHGRQSLHLTNGTGFGAHVYGMLSLAQPVHLAAGKPYTMSAWVKSEAPGVLSLIGGAEWQFRVQATPTDGQWRRIWKTFTPAAQDGDFVLRLSTESPTAGVWVDDLELEAGTIPTFDVNLTGNQVVIEAETAVTEIQGDGPFGVAFILTSPRALAGEVSAGWGEAREVRQPVTLAPGVWRVRVKGESATAGDAPRKVALRLREGNLEAAAATATVRFFSASNALARLSVVRAQLPALQADLAAVKARGQDVSYPTITATVLTNFAGYAAEDARRGEVRRALEQTADLENMAARLRGELKAALAGQREFAAVPRWTGAQRPVVRNSSFLGPVRMPGGALAERPVFFTGYGHFNQVVEDLEKWPAYGANIIQIEVGPSRVLPREGQVDGAPARELLDTLDRAQRAGVAVCLLISPHYFPDWALAKWPHLRKHREGFLQYCLHAPEGRELLRRFVGALLPPLKDHPALHSLCLSNEPINQEEPCAAGRAMWHGWLAKRHGNVATLNAAWGTHFAAITDAPLPDPYGAQPAPAQWLDYIRFNQEVFADWHRLLADAVHEVAPGLPVHAKAMTWTLLNDGEVKYGVDAALFAGFSHINGNDSVNLYEFGDQEFAQGWELNALSHDLQRSLLDAPVFNTENHLIADRDTRPVPPAHIRAALWQAAVHGQSATTIWVWERTFDPNSDFAGSIMHRPAAAEAVGVVNYDLNRAALEITALQQAPAQALLLQSVTAAVWDGGAHRDALEKVYTALAFTGVKLGFITERQLEAGVVPSTPVVLVPAVVHLSRAALLGLRRYQGRLVLVGGDEVLTRDECGQPNALGVPVERVPLRPGATSAHNLYDSLREKFAAWGLRPAVEVRGSDHQPIWGVEWRTAATTTGTVVNLCNYRRQAVDVMVTREGRPGKARDVLTGAPINGPFSLAPLDVRLLLQE